MATGRSSATPRVLIAATAAALVLTLSACGGGDGPDDGGAEDVPPGPIDQLFQDLHRDASGDDGDARRMRVEELIAECMAEEGFDYTPVDYASIGRSYSSEDLDVRWGTVEFAERYGYGATTDPWEDVRELIEESTDPDLKYVVVESGTEGEADMSRVGAGGPIRLDVVDQESLGSMSETEAAAYHAALYGVQPDPAEEEWEDDVWSWEDSGCSGWAQHEVYGDAVNGIPDGEFAELDAEMDAMWEAAANDPRMAALEAEWAACMGDAGYPNLARVGDAENLIYDQTNEIYENAPSLGPDATEEDYRAVADGIQDQLSAITGQEIEIAVADFTCRDEVGYTKTQRDIESEYEQEFYDAHKDELEAWAATVGARS